MTPPCSIPDCGRHAIARTYCTLHYSRWKTSGDPLRTAGDKFDPARIKRARDAYFWANVDVRGPDECWPWLRTLGRGGYGQMRGYDRSQTAHSFAWELENGPIPDGMTLEHTCHTQDADCYLNTKCPHRACCNPRHLGLLTLPDNMELAHRTLRKDGTPKRPPGRLPNARRRAPVTECSVEGCQVDAKHQGMCRRHYTRLLRHGDPTVVHKRGPKPSR